MRSRIVFCCVVAAYVLAAPVTASGPGPAGKVAPQGSPQVDKGTPSAGTIGGPSAQPVPQGPAGAAAQQEAAPQPGEPGAPQMETPESEHRAEPEEKIVPPPEGLPPVHTADFQKLKPFGQQLMAAALGAEQPAVPVAPPPTYVIGPEDVLRVVVISRGVQHVNQGIQVSMDGGIVLPEVGRVAVAGNQLQQVQARLAEAYSKFYEPVEVYVAVEQTRTMEVYVLGEVARPGKYVLGAMATIFSGLYAAGGPTANGDLTAVSLSRRGEPPKVIDLYPYLITGDRTLDYELQPDDTIFVPVSSGRIGIAGRVRRPAIYELRAAKTIAEALQLAGGTYGDARLGGVEVWRPNPDSGAWTLLQVDLSRTGEMGRDTVLRDGDWVYVPTVAYIPRNTVEITGEVFFPGYYQLTPNMRVSHLLNMAGGLTDRAHTRTAFLWRMRPDNDYDLVEVPLERAMAGDPAADVELRARDKLQIFAKREVEPDKTVKVEGCVRFPGSYDWSRGMRLADLIFACGGLTRSADSKQVRIVRMVPNQQPKILWADLDAALAGDAAANVELEAEDQVTVFQLGELRPRPEVRVAGLVQKPDVYRRYHGMKVSDAILSAGGLAATAGDTVYLAKGRTSELEVQRLTLWIEGDHFRVEPDPELEDDDVVLVTGKGNAWAKAALVTLAGAVAKPGPYAVDPSDKQSCSLYRVITSAGGILEDANPHGIFVVRPRHSETGEDQLQQVLAVAANFDREETLVANATETEQAVTGTVAQGLASVFASEQGVAVVMPPRKLKAQAWTEAIPVNWQLLTKTQGTEGDVLLQPGDTVMVSRRADTIGVVGAVPKTGRVPHWEGMTVAEAVKACGGYAEDADRSRLVVVHANSATEQVKRPDRHVLLPGDIVVVPSRYLVQQVRTEGAFQRTLRALSAVVAALILAK